MTRFSSPVFLLPLVFAAVSSASLVERQPIVEIATHSSLSAASAANIHLRGVAGEKIDITYGDCETGELHHKITTTTSGDKRLIWLIPEDAPANGCISAWQGNQLVGRSASLTIGADNSEYARRKRSLEKRQGYSMGEENGIDASGPWFDGVQYLKDLDLSEVDVQKAKSKQIGIVGGGMAGLMTGMLLDSVGLKKWKILEGSDRIGGRIRTAYFGKKPEDYQYQEMGPMRFPESIHYPGTNETLPINDQKLVFDLADKLNKMNKNDPKREVKFIPWYQSSLNGNNLVYQGGVRLPDGTVPTIADIGNNATLRYIAETHGPEIAAEIAAARANVSAAIGGSEWTRGVALDMYRTHKKFIDEGFDSWSELAYVNKYLGYSLNVTDLIGSSSAISYWSDIFEGAYFTATTWKTIDKGLQRLPDAIEPHVKGRVDLNKKIKAISFDKASKKVTLTYGDDSKVKPKRNAPKYKSETFDYAVVSAPFPVVRTWRMTPRLSSTIRRAVTTLRYDPACKVALQFKTRFWEHLAKPIFGGCSSTDIPQIGSFCYPAYNINGTGPGVMLSSYQSGENGANSLVALSDDEHAAYVLDAMAEVHGDIVYKQYTGKYDRICWSLDEFARGGWASPAAGQHELYIPSYFRTENNLVFIGEHTSYTHAWIASALESAIRGTVQLLLDMGLVDEAKQITQEWMHRWIRV